MFLRNPVRSPFSLAAIYSGSLTVQRKPSRFSTKRVAKAASLRSRFCDPLGQAGGKLGSPATRHQSTTISSVLITIAAFSVR